MPNINSAAERYNTNLNNNGARIRRQDGTTESVNIDFNRKGVEQYIKSDGNTVTLELDHLGIDVHFLIAFRRDGYVDSGTTANSRSRSYTVFFEKTVTHL